MLEFTKNLQIATTSLSLGAHGAPWEFNLRDILRWIQLSTKSSRSGRALRPFEHVDTLFTQRFRTTNDRDAADRLFHTTRPDTPETSRPYPSLNPYFLQVGHTTLSPFGNRRPWGVLKHSQLSPLQAAGICLEEGWMVVLTGSRGAGKTALAEFLAAQAGQRLGVLPMTSATDASDLVGTFEQVEVSSKLHELMEDCIMLGDQYLTDGVPILLAEVDASLGLLRDLITKSMSTTPITRIVEVIRSFTTLPPFASLSIRVAQLESFIFGVSQGQFQWVDGPLLRAMEDGTWLLLDNANLCNPAVLDRLNSLTEMNGTLTLSERGLVNGEIQVLRPHPNFRLLMSVDPGHGELSRAMRNRGVEIFLIPTDTAPATPIPEYPTISPRSHLSDDLLQYTALLEYCGNDALSTSFTILSETLPQIPEEQITTAAFLAQAVSPLEWSRSVRVFTSLAASVVSALHVGETLSRLKGSSLFTARDRETTLSRGSLADEFLLSVGFSVSVFCSDCPC